jgi:Na+-driven multidrug efflux pump
MVTQALGVGVHILGNYFFVYKLHLGIVGTGCANFVTNAFLLSLNIYFTSRQEELKEALEVSIKDL